MRRATTAVGIVAAAGVALSLTMWSVDAEPDGVDQAFRGDGSTLVSTSGEAMSFGTPPRSYTVVYERESVVGSDRSIMRETLMVARPFQSRTEAEADDGAVAFTRRSGFGEYENESREGRRGVLTVPPALAANDLRPDVALPAAVGAGIVELGDRRRVLGRECQVYRAGAPLSSGDLVAYDPDGSEWAESCFDREGLLLEERWWLERRAVERVVARSISFDPPDRSTLAIEGEPVSSFGDGNGSVREVASASRLPSPAFHELRGIPDRFEHRGRYAVVWPAGSAVRGSGDRVGTLADVWVDGIDVIIFERGGTLHGSAVLESPKHATPVALGGAGDGVLVLGLRGNEVRVHPAKGEFVRVVATLAPDELIELASGIDEVAGGRLVELSP